MTMSAPVQQSNDGRRVRYLWPLRVPIISGAVLVLLPLLAFTDAARPFLSGLFDPVDAKAIVMITALALLNAWAVLIIGCLIVTYGAVRFGLPPRRCAVPPAPRSWLIVSTLAVYVIYKTAATVGATEEVGHLEAWLYVVAGLGVASALFGVASTVNWLAHRFASRVEPAGWYRGILTRLLHYPSISAGFIEAGPPPKVAPGHAQAFGLACASMVAFLAVGYLARDLQRPVWVSTLAYVLLLQLLLTWLTGFAAFLFDRSRAPLFVFAGIWFVAVNSLIHPYCSTGHAYRTALLPPAAGRTSPESLFGSEAASIVIAASGGGIQSAAWTARVLTGLDQSLPAFRGHVRVISAVSGGSVGSMNVLASWPECGPALDPREAQGFDPNAASRESSLHAVGWGLVFKDLPRTGVPFFASSLIDRGSVLEDAWKREPRLRRPYPEAGVLLASWRRNVAERYCPAMIYNAMAVETGEPMLFATAGLPPSLQRFDFYARYPQRDVAMTTAVRLSAGFPYVSPASHADVDRELGHYTHVVDGGYFDNYGISTLVTLVTSGLANAAVLPPRRRLLVIEICDTASCSGADPRPGVSRGGGDQAWTYQLRAPLSAVIAMRSSAQRVNNRAAIRLLKDYWFERDVCVESVQAPFGGTGAPMSWHLTATQKHAVDTEWNAIAPGLTEAVEKFLGGGAATMEGERCK